LGCYPAFPPRAKKKIAVNQSTIDQRNQTVHQQTNIANLYQAPPPGTNPQAPYTDLSRLAPAIPPVPFVGRESEKNWLSAQLADPGVALALLHGGPGIGKSALVFDWLLGVHTQHRETHWIFGWSFSGQGEETENSAGDFFHAIGQFFGLADNTPAELAEAVGRLLQQRPVVLVLDGLEAVQGRAGQAGAGKIGDHALHDLLAEALLYGLRGHSLIVLCSQQPLADLGQGMGSRNARLESWELPLLDETEAAQVLRGFQLDGSQRDWQRVLAETNGHPLSLILLGGLLRRRFGGRLHDFVRLEHALQRPLSGAEGSGAEGLTPAESAKLRFGTPAQPTPEQRARRLLDYYAEDYWGRPRWQERYADWRSDESLGEEPVFLALLGLVDGPLEAAVFDLLLREPEDGRFAEFYAYLAPLRERRKRAQAAVPAQRDWRKRAAQVQQRAFGPLWQRLEQAGLLLPALLDDNGLRTRWDTHSLLRAGFGEHCRKHHLRVWEQGHALLFRHYAEQGRKLTHAIENPTLPQLLPFYTAARHACQAGMYRDALEIYRAHILRFKDENGQWTASFYSVHQLGAQARDLALLAGFFPLGWSGPVVPDLRENERNWVLGEAAFDLMNLGRLSEAVAPMRAMVDLYVADKGWKNASISVQTRSDVLLALGRPGEAEQQARAGLDYAQKLQPSYWFMEMGSTVTIANVLYRQGWLTGARRELAQAETIQARGQPHLPRLYSLQGVRYCALLLAQARPGDSAALREILERGQYLLECAKQGLPKWDTAYAHLMLAQAHAALSDTETARAEFGLAVAGVREADRLDFSPEFLLARAAFLYAQEGASATVFKDLNAAADIIRRGDMALYELELHLLWGTLWLDQGKPDLALTQWRLAARLLDSTGHYLREGECALLAARLAHAGLLQADAEECLWVAKAHIEGRGHWAILPQWEKVRAACGVTMDGPEDRTTSP